LIHAVYALLAAAAFDAQPWLDDFRAPRPSLDGAQ
jgi:hypothetical protein